jgi:hypothetical protein
MHSIAYGAGPPAYSYCQSSAHGFQLLRIYRRTKSYHQFSLHGNTAASLRTKSNLTTEEVPVLAKNLLWFLSASKALRLLFSILLSTSLSYLSQVLDSAIRMGLGWTLRKRWE